MSAQPAQHKKTVKVTVIFPVSPAGAFHAEEPLETTVGVIRQAAMSHFGVADDAEHDYYLTHDARRVANESTIGELAPHEEAVKLTLVKELIQGLA
jgi:hypothetical protein